MSGSAFFYFYSLFEYFSFLDIYTSLSKIKLIRIVHSLYKMDSKYCP